MTHFNRYLIEKNPENEKPDDVSCMHFTNNCLQIKNKVTYGIHEEGNIVSFEDFQAYLDEKFPQY